MKVDIFNTDKKCNIIYTDPPWLYNDKRAKDPAWGGITYNVLSIEEICNMGERIRRISSRDCVLFLWVTMPMLQEGQDVIRAWGFKYKTCAFCWVKQNPKNDGIYSGLGHWTNGNAELCLLATKGHPKRIAKNVKQIVIAHRGRHSAKPAEVRERIVQLLGDVPRIELFAREQADGWDCWGNEV